MSALIELNVWALEMSDCYDVDPQFAWQYYNTLGETSIYEVIRLRDFLNRHNLDGQFLADDAQGQR